MLRSGRTSFSLSLIGLEIAVEPVNPAICGSWPHLTRYPVCGRRFSGWPTKGVPADDPQTPVDDDGDALRGGHNRASGRRECHA
jgi:hypothetical protein